jgi:hypothetical protein
VALDVRSVGSEERSIWGALGPALLDDGRRSL